MKVKRKITRTEKMAYFRFEFHFQLKREETKKKICQVRINIVKFYYLTKVKDIKFNKMILKY